MRIKKYSGLITIGMFIIILFIITPFLCNEKHSNAKYIIIYPDTSSRNYFNIPDTTFNFVMQLKTHVVGRGNVHTMDCSRWENDYSTWIYLKHRVGKLDSSQFILTSVYGRSDSPWAENAVRGYIELTRDSVEINIEILVYNKDKPNPAWSHYGWNGKYPLQENIQIPPSDKWTI